MVTPLTHDRLWAQTSSREDRLASFRWNGTGEENWGLFT